MHPQAITPAGTNPKTVGGHAFTGALIGGGVGFFGAMAWDATHAKGWNNALASLAWFGLGTVGAVLGGVVGLAVGQARLS